MDHLFTQLVGNVVQFMIYKEETRYLDAWGCKRINHTLCAQLKHFRKHVHSHPTLDEFVVYHYHPCQPRCEYAIPIEDAIPSLMYTVMEYGRLLSCKSLYIFHMLTKFENRYPNEADFIAEEENQEDDHGIQEEQAQEHQGIQGIDRLTPYTLSNTIPDQVCCICQEGLLSGQRVITLPCMHTFHTELKGEEECKGIENWLCQSTECPLCKQKIE
jgi:hypothetical protein